MHGMLLPVLHLAIAKLFLFFYSSQLMMSIILLLPAIGFHDDFANASQSLVSCNSASIMGKGNCLSEREMKT